MEQSKSKKLIHLIRKILILVYSKIIGLAYLLKIKNVKNIPIIINNFNRLTYLKKLITSLEKRDCTNIIILDNQSTYPPLLEYYETCKYKVVFLDKNYGHKALWDSGYYNKICNDFFVYTDPDLCLVEDCPVDFMSFLMKKLVKYRIEKIGLGLKIDDLPDHYNNKLKVIEWETQFWNIKVEDNVYNAKVDTTFALYSPFTKPYYGSPAHIPAYRTVNLYMCYHLPWYENYSNLDEENLYYLQSTNSSSEWLSEKNRLN